MLTHLHIQHFAIIDNIEIDFSNGMSVLTGETGAGKSILLDALMLALGYRANTALQNTKKCEISAAFDIAQLPTVQAWLAEQDLTTDDTCVLRRVITPEGRSRPYINGSLVPLQQLKALGTQLLTIHGQHDNQGLLKRDQQRHMLDAFADNAPALKKVTIAYQAVSSLQKQYADLNTANTERESQLALLSFQVQDLEKLTLIENEYEALDQEHKRLANASTLITQCQQALTLAEDNTLSGAQQALMDIDIVDNQLKNIIDTFQAAEVQAQEATHDLRHYLDTLNIDDARLAEIDQRIGALYTAARKYRIQPKQLYEHYQTLHQRLQDLTHHDERLAEIEAELTQAKTVYLKQAVALRKTRQKAAKKLSQAVTQRLQTLNMAGGELNIQCSPLDDDTLTIHGIDHIEFLVKTNPGQALQPLNKIASGGELSRISLAICVLTAEQQSTPTLIFDEVDTGIGGQTAGIVGQLLQALGQHVQVLCVTHLPQVAAYATQHFKLSKQQSAKDTQTRLTLLDENMRVEEIGRMLGGLNVTDQTLAHAAEMLAETT